MYMTRSTVLRCRFSIGPEGKGIETSMPVSASIGTSTFSIGPEGKGIETVQTQPLRRAQCSALALKEKGLRQRSSRCQSPLLTLSSALALKEKGLRPRHNVYSHPTL